MDNSTLTYILFFGCPVLGVGFILFVARKMDIRVKKREMARIEQLATTGAETAVPQLIRYLTFNNRDMRNAACVSLIKLGPSAVSKLVDALGTFNFWLMLNAYHTSYKRYICYVLGELGDSRAVPALDKQMTRGDILAVAEAVEALRKIGTSDARMVLQTAAQSGKPYSKVLAQIALLDPHDETGRSALVDGLHSASPLVRLQAVRILAGIDAPEAIVSIQQMVYDPFPENRDAALAALNAAGQPVAAPGIHPLEAGRKG